uniref:Uncharacterized protein n=1 Tax=viral metagenome TaxID=1070528 RepID=A0A6M3XZT7_9ZZZZ
MKKQPKFKIGDWVEFRYEAKILTEEKIVGSGRLYKRMIVRKSVSKKIGQIVGAIYRFDGEVTPQSGSYDDYEPGYLQVNKSNLLWQVRIGYLNKPHEVFEEDLVFDNGIIRLNEARKLPWKYTENHYHKNIDMFPRDAKGRFCK